MKLFDENGKPVGLYEIAQWFIDIYPEDIFVTKPIIIIEIRNKFKQILKKIIKNDSLVPDSDAISGPFRSPKK